LTKKEIYTKLRLDTEKWYSSKKIKASGNQGFRKSIKSITYKVFGCIEGSNPSLSARYKRTAARRFFCVWWRVRT